MIIQFIMIALTGFLVKIIGSISFDGITTDLSGVSTLADIIGKGFVFFPSWLWGVCIANIVAWKGLHFAWAIIEWVYKKVPGVD